MSRETITSNCPFCGSNLLAIGYDGQPAIRAYIACMECNAHGPSVYCDPGGSIPTDIVGKWNARTDKDKYRYFDGEKWVQTREG